MSESLVETIEYKGCSIEVYSDYDTESPRDWDNLGTMVCWHNKGILGDGHKYAKNSPEQFVWELAEEYYNSDVVQKWRDDRKEKEFIEYCLEKLKNYVVFLPLYIYDHGGITIKTYPFSCQWDSGQVGWVYITKEDIRKEYLVKNISKKVMERAKNLIEAKVQTYAYYLEGSVYGYIAKDEEGGEIESCWGFYGYDHKKSGLLENAERSIDLYLEQKEKERILEEKNKVYNRYKSFEEWKRAHKHSNPALYQMFEMVFENLEDKDALDALKLDLTNTIQEMNEEISEIDQWLEWFSKQNTN